MQRNGGSLNEEKSPVALRSYKVIKAKPVDKIIIGIYLNDLLLACLTSMFNKLNLLSMSHFIVSPHLIGIDVCTMLSYDWW